MKKTIETTLWATREEYLAKIYDLEEKNHTDGIGFAEWDMSSAGWIRIGTATIHLDLIDPKDTVAAQVESLEAQCKKVMADSEATLTILRSRINDLLAIENSGGGK